jgi:hypothetical protein
MRTIIDGTTYMREPPDWIVLSMTASDRFLTRPPLTGLFGARRSMSASSPVRQQGGPRRARDDHLSISSKLRQRLAQPVYKGLVQSWRGLRGEGVSAFISWRNMPLRVHYGHSGSRRRVSG